MLESKAAFNTLRCFAADLVSCILLRIDNTTALAYIWNLKTTLVLVWRQKYFCLIYFFYRKFHYWQGIPCCRSRYSLSDEVFQQIAYSFGPFEVDLFASSINNKCEAYVPWSRDPGSIAVDAFTLSWKGLSFYAFPPFILLSTSFKKNSGRGNNGN